MVDTLRALDEAIQRHIAECFPGALVDSWALVTHSQDLSDSLSNYRFVSNETQPYHIDSGLLTVGQKIIEDSWDRALLDEDDDE